MRYKRMTVRHCDIDDWWIAIKSLGLIAVNNNYRPKFKMKLSRKAKK